MKFNATLSRPRAAGLVAAALASLMVVPLPSQAAAKSKGHAKMAASKIYVCRQCHEYFSAASAKKMGFKDGMGHKLVAASKAPAGYADGAKSGSM